MTQCYRLAEKYQYLQLRHLLEKGANQWPNGKTMTAGDVAHQAGSDVVKVANALLPAPRPWTLKHIQRRAKLSKARVQAALDYLYGKSPVSAVGLTKYYAFKPRSRKGPAMSDRQVVTYRLNRIKVVRAHIRHLWTSG